ncbi:MAG: ATP-binding protein [Magnetococcus sp. WYHC-3]
MSAPGHRRLAVKLIIATLPVGALLAVLGTLCLLYLEYSRSIDMLEQQIDDVAVIHMESLSRNVWVEDRALLALLARGLDQLPHFSRVVIRDAQGQVLAQSGTGVGTETRTLPLIHHHRGENLTIGSLELTISHARIYRQLSTQIWAFLLVSCSVILLVGLFISLQVHRIITRPLESMAAQSRDVARKGSDAPIILPQRPHFGCHDELTELVNALNELRAQRFRSHQLVSESEQRYRNLFAESPVPLLEKDYARVMEHLGALRKQGMSDLKEQMRTDPPLLHTLAGEVDLLNINAAALLLHRGDTPQDLLDPADHLRSEGGEEAFISKLQALLDGRRRIHAEGPLVARDGSKLHVLSDWLRLPDTSENRLLVVESQWDLTQRKHTEQELRLARDAALRADQAKGQFLATMSHEIRTPMNAILGMADILAETPGSSKEALEFLEVLRRNGRALLTLINDILDLSKLEAGRIHVEATAFDLVSLVESLAQTYRLVAADRKLDIQLTLPQHLHPWRSGDALRLRQVLNNLLGNAVKFTDHGVIRLCVFPDAEEQDVLWFTVSDTGIGIPGNKLEEVFDLFTQAEHTTTRKYGGTGLGLYLCRQLVTMMQGEMTVDSVMGQGSAFYFHLPLPRVAPPAQDMERASLPMTALPEPARSALPKPTQSAPRESAPSALPEMPVTPPGPTLSPSPADSAAPPPPILAGKRILLAEDSDDNVLLVQVYLKKQNLTLVVAPHGQAALEHLQRTPFDLVLMDMQMPIMDGFSATSAIRTWESAMGRPRTPIIALTALALKGDMERCLAAGCDRYLTKPVQKGRLIAEMEQALAATGRSATPT